MTSLSEYFEESLYPLQNGVLRAVENCKTQFFLTGGNALSRAYYRHRYSDDLDFFVNNVSDFHEQVDRVFVKLKEDGFLWDDTTDFISRDSFVSFKVYQKKSDEVLNPYLSQLLEWLEDLNWPGAWIILERLIKYSDIETLSRHVERYVKKKVACGTWEELSALDHMCRIIENEKLKVALSAETLEVLQKHYNDPGWWDTE